MRLNRYLRSNDNEMFMNQIREVNEIVLGVNTWLYFENPLVEGVYYPIDRSLNEEEKSHFHLLNEIAGKGKERKYQSWMGAAQDKDMDSQSEWDKEVEKAFKDINKKSRKAYQNLDSLGKKSFVAKYILHGLETKRTQKAKWGRMGKAGSSPKEIYADGLKSYKEKQRFVNAVIQMVKQHEKERKEGEKHLNSLIKRFKSLPDLEMQMGQTKDGFSSDLFELTKDRFGKGWFPEEAYLEFLYKIKAKQYNSKKELEDCIKQWSAIGDNDKTGLSVDMSTVCPKREKLLEMMREWTKAQNDLTDAIESGAEESTINQLRAREEKLKVTDANNPTCAYCYVEAGREILATNPSYSYAKAEKKGLRYQDTFMKWVEKEKDGTPKVDKKGNFILSKKGVEKREMFNKMGGLRFFGSGDYIENEATDKEIERIIADAEELGLQLKAITKQEKFVKKYGGRVFFKGPLKGKPVFNINMSVDEQLGFNLTVAKSLKKQYPGNVNIRVVARNPEEAIKYSKDKDIDVITLLHFKRRPKRMANKELYVNMSGKSEGWKAAIAGMKKAHPRANWNKVLSKLCCTNGHCTKCPNACGFNPRRVADYTQLAKGGKLPLQLAA